MKKIIFGAAMLVMLCCALLTSCLITPGPAGPGSGSGDGSEIEFTKLIKPADKKYDNIDFNELKDTYSLKADLYLYVLTDVSEPEADGEVVIGETNRTITATAKGLLEKAVKKADNDDEIGFIIYCDGRSIALYWDDNYTRVAGYKYFYENIVLEGVNTFEEGTVHIETMDKSESKKAEEAIEIEEEFAAVAELIGQEAADALRAHIALYDERYYQWIAGLYDPGTGGFYYSNEALKNQGFLPDVESTQQAITFFKKAGMWDKYYGGDPDRAIPEWMQEQLIEWVRGLQSPEDGYFYHPQWGTDIIPSRQNRDLGWATSCLKQFGAKPKWNAPNGTKGEYGKVPGSTAVTGQLSGGSAVEAVSMVILTADLSIDQFPTRLKTLEGWREYILCTMNGNESPDDETPNKIRTNSYRIGNDVGGHSSQLKQRDQLGLDTGEFKDADNDGIADGGFVETTERIFNSWLLDYNGLWEHYKSIDPETGELVDDPNGVPYYGATNGLMKTGSMYNSIGIKHPYAENAIQSAIYMINYMNIQSDGKPGPDITGDRPGAIVDVYNPWVCVADMLNNIRDFGSPAEKAALQVVIRENAAEMIRNTTAKVVHFRKDDGSYGYRWEAGGTTSQGATVTTGLKNEGDVNGGCISVTGVTYEMYTALGIPKVAIFRDSDWDECVKIFESASPVLKDPIVLDAKVHDFEDYDVGTTGDGIDGITATMNSGYVSIINSPHSDKGYGGGNSLKFVAATTGKGDNVKFGVSGSGTCYFLEFDIYIDEIEDKSQTLFQITMGSAYRLTINSTKGSNMVYIADSNNVSAAPISNNLGIYFGTDEWHRIRVEYYPGSADTVVTKIFFDEQLRAVSTNYYGRNDTLATPVAPSTKYTYAQFYSLNPCIQTTYLDNVCAGKSADVYTEQEIEMPYLVKDFESSDSMFQTDLGYNAVVVADPTGTDNKALGIYGSNTSTFLGTAVDMDGNCFALELSVYADEMANGDSLYVYLHSGTVSKSPVAWQIRKEGGSLSIYEVHLNGTSESVDDTPIAGGIDADEWVSLRFEYYRYQYDDEYTYCSSIIYMEGRNGYTELCRGTAYYNINNMRNDYSHVSFVTVGSGNVYLDDIKPTKEQQDYRNAAGILVPDTDTPFPQGAADIKNPGTPADHTGEYDFEGDYTDGISIPGFATDMNELAYGNNAQIVADPTGAGKGNVLEMTTVKGDNGNSSIYDFSKVETRGNCYVFEFDIYVDYYTGSMQCFVRNADNENIVAFSLEPSVSTNSCSLKFYGKDNSGSKVLTTVTVPRGWVNVRMEYYHDAKMVVLYVNGDRACETNMVYNNYSNGATPASARIFSLSGAVSHYYLDNVVAKVIEKSYSAN